jgi:hypothetical protein
MSKLNINRNIFLEREELLRWQKFMLESPVNKTFLANTSAWGIIDTSGGGTVLDFKVEAGTNPGTVKIYNLSRALISSGLMIEQSAIDNVAIPNDGNYYWLKIGHQYSNIEEGVCSITSDGQVTGVNTIFTDVLRGQSLETPVKIKFSNSINNTGIYEVVDVVNDTNLILSGNSFTAESGLKYFVVGCTPIGETITSEQQLGLYFYDSCNLTQVLETTLDTTPSGKVQDSEFWIARVINNSGTVTIVDKRTEYWEYYIKGVSDKLTKTNNLSDLTDLAEARNNLDVYSKEEVDVLVSTDTVGWTSMNRAAAAQNTGFDLKVCRVGKTISISGRFKPAANVNGVDIATLSLSTIAEGLSLNNRIWSQSNEVSGGSTNYGITFYVETFDPDTQPILKLVCDTNYGGELFGIQYAFVNITFLAV